MEATSTLAELVEQHRGAAAVLDELRLDYCCGGHRSVADACAAAGLDPHEVLAAVARADAAPTSWPDPPHDPVALVDHLTATHHAYLKAELPLLVALATKVRDVHGERHPELAALRATVGELADDLLPHLAKEEQVLFPMVRELAAAATRPTLHCGSVANPIRVMRLEHDRAGELLARVHDLTDGYRPPDDACASYRQLFERLAHLEADTHRHVHAENNLLFPAVEACEAALAP